MDVYIPDIESTTKVEENYITNGKLIKNEVFDKKMINFAKELKGRNIKLNAVAAETTVKINKEGIVVKGIISADVPECSFNITKAFRPLRMILDKPFVYALSVGKEIVAFGTHN